MSIIDNPKPVLEYAEAKNDSMINIIKIYLFILVFFLISNIFSRGNQFSFSVKK